MPDGRIGDTAAEVAQGLARAAMQRGDWQAVIQAFPERADLAPEAHEIMARACFALFDLPAMQRHVVAANEGYTARGSVLDMARTTLDNACGRLALDGDHAVCLGYIDRAAQLLATVEERAEHGWLELARALWVHHPRYAFEAAFESAQRAHALGVQHGDHALEAEGLAAMGFLAIHRGQVAEGLRQLDHSASLAATGYVRDPVSVATVIGQMLRACELIEDYTRSAQWFRTIERMHSDRPMPLLEGLVRNHLAHALIERGEWAEAERVLAMEGLATHYVRTQLEAERGLLRLRQGRLDEAETHFRAGGTSPYVALGLATIAFERGDAATARDLLERQLRNLPEVAILPRYRTELNLALMRAATGDMAGADAAAQAVTRLAAVAGTPGPRAAAAHSWGRIALLRGQHEQARVHFEDAIDGAQQAALPFREAVSRIGLGEALQLLGREAAGHAEREQGMAILSRLGAQPRVDALQRGLPFNASMQHMPEPAKLPLSARELEVLRLVAQGMSNKQVAAELHLSEHTIKRHVANILKRLDLPSRAAAVAFVAREGKL
ncbi:MAG: LuxR C-terminal-related transcriptional regulator [Candidatus Eisenbacteria bacterium]|nr:LuxR C-terminal-related transcriptional regulator [Candidatus Eisenbacteria bacterium]